MSDRTRALVDEMLHRLLQGQVVPVDELLAAHPELDPAAQDRVRRMAALMQGHALPPTGSSLRFGPYCLVRELGRGGQGIVYLARDTRLSRMVALKVLNRPDLMDDSPRGPAARLQREAEVASRLEHPGICVVYEMGVVERQPYLAMRYLAGETLATKIARCQAAGARVVDLGGASESEALCLVAVLVERIARALHAAHELGIVHRDVKPANVMVTPEGQPVLLDFGLARDQESDEPSLTLSDAVFGTAPYMAPEQIDPHGVRSDRRTDVYALGVVLYEALTLKRPFAHPTREGLYRRILGESAAPVRATNPAVARDLAVVVATALEKERSRRYQTALDLAEDLRRWRERMPILARPAGPVLRTRRWVQRNRVLTASLLAVFSVMTLGLWIQSRHAAELLGRNLLLSSVLTRNSDPALALLLAIEGARRSPGSRASQALNESLAELHELRSRAMREPGERDVNDARFSADGRWVAAIVDHQRVRIWERATLQAVQTVRVEGDVRRLDFAPDGQHLALGFYDGRVERLSTRWWRRDGELAPHPSETMDLVHSPDGCYLFSTCRRCVRLDDLRSGTSQVFDQDTDQPGRASFSRDGRYLLVALQGAACVMDVRDGFRVVPLPGVGPPELPGAFSPDGSRVIACTRDGAAVAFDVRTGSRRQEFAPDPAGAKPGFAAFSPDGQLVLIAGGARVRVFAGDATVSRSTYLGHAAEIRGIVFAPDGAWVLTHSGDRSIQMWDPRSPERPLAILRGSGGGVLDLWLDRSPTGHAFSATIDGRLWQWDLRSFGARQDLGRFKSLESVLWASFDPARERVAGVWRNRIEVLDLQRRSGFLGAEDWGLRSVAWSPDGQRVVVVGESDTASFWDAAQEGRSGDSAPQRNALLDACFSHDGRLALASGGPLVRVSDSAGATTVAGLRGHDRGTRCVRFSADGQWVLGTSEADDSILVWNAAGGPPVARLSCPDWTPVIANFSPDGNRVAATYHRRSAVLVWDWRTGEVAVTLQLEPLGSAASDVVYSPDGRWLACACSDRVRVHDAMTGVLGSEWPEPGPKSLAYTPDGAWLLAACGDGTIRRWPSDPLAEALRRMPRDLTQDERAQYGLPGR